MLLNDRESYKVCDVASLKSLVTKVNRNLARPKEDKVIIWNTNAIEAYRSRLKKKLREHGPIRGRNIWAHVDEAQYRLWYGLKAGNLPQAWELFLKHIADAYPVADRTCSAEDEAQLTQS
nr:unnamed protein product [Spirometra erinaceieuropaei]